MSLGKNGCAISLMAINTKVKLLKAIKILCLGRLVLNFQGKFPKHPMANNGKKTNHFLCTAMKKVIFFNKGVTCKYLQNVLTLSNSQANKGNGGMKL